MAEISTTSFQKGRFSIEATAKGRVRLTVSDGEGGMSVFCDPEEVADLHTVVWSMLDHLENDNPAA